jgi:hypothetical protein
MTPSQFAFFKSFIKDFFESAFLNGQVSSSACDRLKSWCDSPSAKGYASELFSSRAVCIKEHQLDLNLRTLREINGREFYHIEVLSTRKKKRPRRRCFVGHRFVLPVEKALRWNLRHILEPYNIELDWSGRDIRSVQILQDIISKIKRADFCVFDNQATKGKPNVYIEAGMCIVLKKPFVLFDYEPKSKEPTTPEPVPSDLAFALGLRYKDYKQLFRDFYFRLPLFVEKNVD